MPLQKVIIEYQNIQEKLKIKCVNPHPTAIKFRYFALNIKVTIMYLKKKSFIKSYSVWIHIYHFVKLKNIS